MKKFKIPQINVSPGFFIVISLSALLDYSGTFCYAMAALIVHEAGHLICIRFLKIPIECIKFRLFGIEICANISNERRTSAIMLSGPLANLLFAGICYILINCGYAVVQEFFYCSFILGCFHIMPVQGLDGGYALMYISQSVFTKISVKVFTLTASFLLIIKTFDSILSGNCNFSPLILAIYLILNILSEEKVNESRKSID